MPSFEGSSIPEPLEACIPLCAGLLDVAALLASLGRSQDVLGALAALQLLEELSARCDSAAAQLLSAAAMPQLLALSRGGEPMLQSQALQVRRRQLWIRA